jgi:hypothetical protein
LEWPDIFREFPSVDAHGEHLGPARAQDFIKLGAWLAMLLNSDAATLHGLRVLILV